MAGYPPDSHVMVRPFTHRREGDTVTIGDIDRQVFLAIPAEGMDILDSLAAGHTVGETVRRYEQRYDETPDIEDFLDALQQEGFVQPRDAAAVPEAAAQPAPKRSRRSWSMEWLPERTARRLLSAPILIVLGLISVAGVAVNVIDPQTMPTPKALLFPVNFAALTWATFSLALVGVALHEFAHGVAARAAGIPARLGLGNQLYVLVAQTDLSGIWLVPKRRRYLAFMVGSLVDLVSYSILAMVVYTGRHGWYHLPRNADLLISAVMLTYGTRVAWQWFFFLRTDGYYVVATALNCKSLLTDTEDYLYNKMTALRRAPQRVDQSAIPAREMRVVRWFAPVWIVGRFFAVGFFLLVGIPVLWGYCYQVLLLVTGGHTRFTSIDFATIAVLGLMLDGGGLYLWLRSMYRRGRQRYAARQAARLTSDERLETVAGAREPGMA